MSAFGRRRFLRLAVATAATVAIPATRIAASSPRPVAQDAPGVAPGPSPTPAPPGQLWLLASPDQWDPGVIRSLDADDGIDVRVNPLTDDAEAHADLVAGAVPADLVGADGGWVSQLRADERVEPLHPDSIGVVDELYPMALELSLLATDDGLLGFPWGWSPLQVVCDPARLASIPDSWDVLVDARNRGRVVVESQRMDLVLCAARATGAADPLAMTDAELAAATDWLRRLRPNVRHIVRQRSDAIDLLASGECTLAISALGAPDLVRDADGPELMAYVPREGTIGSLDVMVQLRGSPNVARVPAWLDAAGGAEAAAAGFLRDGRPLFNERAFQLLVDSGHGDRARRYLYDRPETVLDLTLTGPGERPDDYLAAYAAAFDVEG
ncbi:MAG: extracellular solute-binding protein [Chloroflexota bacterium]